MKIKFSAIVLASLLFFGCGAFAAAQDIQPAGIVSDVTEDGVRIVNYRPDDIVCSVNIEIRTRGDVIESVQYTRGCNGNTKGIGALVKGMSMDEAITKLKGITCGKRPTSCPDQLANALIEIKKTAPQKKM